MTPAEFNPEKRFEILPAQQQFLFIDDPRVCLDVCVYQGGFGSGKTFVGSLMGHILSTMYPNNRGLVVAKTYPMIRDTTLVSYFQHFDRIGWHEGKEYIWKASEQKLIYKTTGSEILFKHLDDPGKIKSLNLGWAHMEEMSELSESGFLMLLSRLRLPNIPRYRLFGTTNPQGKKGWVYRYFHHDKTIQVTDPSGHAFLIQYRRIIAPTVENRFLSPVYLENMKQQYSSSYYEMNVMGNDVDCHDGLVCHTWDDTANLDESIVYQPARKLYLTCDFNVDPMCWEMAHRVNLPDGNWQYEFFDELCVENTNITKTAEEFARRYKTHQAGIIITGDASGRQRSDSSSNPNDSKYKILLQTLSDMGMVNVSLDVPTANPHQDIRIETWNGLVCNHQGVRRVKVNPKTCPWLVWNMNNLSYIPGTSVVMEPSPRQIQQDTTHTIKYTKHPFDAASYLTYRYDPLHKNTGKTPAIKLGSQPFQPKRHFF